MTRSQNPPCVDHRAGVRFKEHKDCIIWPRTNPSDPWSFPDSGSSCGHLPSGLSGSARTYPSSFFIPHHLSFSYPRSVQTRLLQSHLWGPQHHGMSKILAEGWNWKFQETRSILPFVLHVWVMCVDAHTHRGRDTVHRECKHSVVHLRHKNSQWWVLVQSVSWSWVQSLG